MFVVGGEGVSDPVQGLNFWIRFHALFSIYRKNINNKKEYFKYFFNHLYPLTLRESGFQGISVSGEKILYTDAIFMKGSDPVSPYCNWGEAGEGKIGHATQN